MYAFVDRPVESLCHGGRFLLWAMRGWSHSIASGKCPPVALAGGFSAIGALPALPDFHIVMAFFNRDALERMSLAPMGCTRIVEDEAILIGLWRDLALGDLDRVRATLGLVVEEDTIPMMLQGMTAVVAKLLAAGFDLSGIADETLKESEL